MPCKIAPRPIHDSGLSNNVKMPNANAEFSEKKFLSHLGPRQSSIQLRNEYVQFTGLTAVFTRNVRNPAFSHNADKLTRLNR